MCSSGLSRGWQKPQFPQFPEETEKQQSAFGRGQREESSKLKELEGLK